MTRIFLSRRSPVPGLSFGATFSKRACLAGAVAILAYAGQAHAIEARYTCSGGTKLTARFSPPGGALGNVALTFETGETLTLPQVMSADGGRYADKGVEFWIKGQNATLSRRGDVETCSTK